MRSLLVIWSMAALASLAGTLFAGANALDRMPDLYLVTLCVLAIFAPPHWVPVNAVLLVLVRAPATLVSPVVSLVIFLAIAELLLFVRRALIARGPLFLTLAGMGVFALHRLALDLVSGPGGAPGGLFMPALLTGLLVPIFAALLRNIPLLRGACTSRAM